MPKLTARWLCSQPVPGATAIALLGLTLCFAIRVTPAGAAPASGSAVATSLAELSIEELMDIEVVSVSRKEQRLSRAAAAVYVITSEEIERSGTSNLPELLRLVPGLDVARINAHSWAISARGFSSQYANKMLVLVDGRTIYTPVFSGVFWYMEDLILEDIERIEVIRGPGATMWGSNAVNGVINVITKTAEATQGGTVSVSGGNLGAHTMGRFGGSLGSARYRVSSRYRYQSSSNTLEGPARSDDWQDGRAAMRIDWESERDSVTLQTGGSLSVAHQTTLMPSLAAPYWDPTATHRDGSKTFVAGTWSRRTSEDSSFEVLFSQDQLSHQDPGAPIRSRTSDLEFRRRVRPHRSHELSWGAGIRYSLDHTGAGARAFFTPSSRGYHLAGAFLQDEILLRGEELVLTLGGKLEQGTLGGLQFQPTARLLWAPPGRHSAWAAVSRAVRNPSRFETAINANPQVIPPSPQTLGLPVSVWVWGDPDFEPETLRAHEAGYRVSLHRRVSLDLAGFYNVYDHLAGIADGTPEVRFAPLPHILSPQSFENLRSGRTYGFEAAGKWRVLDSWRLAGSWSWIHLDLRSRLESDAAVLRSITGQDPSHMGKLQSYIDLPGRMQFDTSLYYVTATGLYASVVGQQTGIPAYVRLDARLAWRPRPNVELSAGGENLLDPVHPERSADPAVAPRGIRRGVTGKITWTF